MFLCNDANSNCVHRPRFSRDRNSTKTEKTKTKLAMIQAPNRISYELNLPSLNWILYAFWFFLFWLLCIAKWLFRGRERAEKTHSVWNNAWDEWATATTTKNSESIRHTPSAPSGLRIESHLYRKRDRIIIQIYSSLAWLKPMWQIVIYT